jgi:hypothetical protein
MFWNRNHVQKQQRVARPSFRPQLECLEARTLLDASGSVTAALATLANDVGQTVNDAVHLHGSAVQQDASKVSQDASNVSNQIHNSPGGDLLIDFITVARGLTTMQTGLVAVEAGVAASAEPGGVALGPQMAFAGLLIYNSGLEMTTTGAEQFIKDLGSLNSGGQQQQQQQGNPPTLSWAGTYSGVLTPVNEGEAGGSAPRTVTVTINKDGSGNISISPFEGETLYGSFPSGSVSVSAVDNVVTLNLDITVSLNVTIIGAGSIHGNQLSLISLDAFDRQFDYDVSVSGPLNKQ